ncbi:hypothetical protein J3S90_10070 [Flavobacterium sp. P4023]|uniref:Lipoprotein n=1 Tax=Flavobacterium flabelliforme TaxID=2816119 RepID=A0ABS5CU37_9FLAO|nr:hypothetical protein [Flavobacterium flabelliforme]MBP4142146.1 hypothetical protein [Flavobacterium flabelliforme]
MKIMTFIALLILLNIFACQNQKIVQKKTLNEIKYSEIEIAEIKKGLYDTLCVELKKNQIKKIVEILNSKKESELLKIMPKYWLFIKFKNDSIKKYKIADNYLGEFDDYIKIETKNNFINVYENNSKTKCKIKTRIE